jgi:hypothetical protein
MKNLISAFVLLISFNVFANDFKSILEQVEVENLIKDQGEKSYNLSKIEDLHASTGIFPRCMCSSYNFTFTKYASGKKNEKTYSVGTTGFGANLKVSIKQSK